MPKAALQGDKTGSGSSSQWQTMYNNTCTGSVHPNITPRDRYRMATTTVQVTPGRHNPSISAQPVHNNLREAGLKAYRPVVRQVLTDITGNNVAYGHILTVAGPDRTGKKVLFTDESQFCLTTDSRLSSKE
jgi:hypothetical protein